MAFTFDSTIKGASANSYVSVEDANDYFGGHPRNNDWSALVPLARQQFLVRATTRLDYEQYGGSVTTSDQALQFPRLWLIARNYDQTQNFVEYTNGNYYRDPEIIPRELKIATYELALWYVDEIQEKPIFSRNDIDRAESITIGPLSAKLRRTKESVLPDEVQRALRAIGPNGWLGARGIKLVR